MFLFRSNVLHLGLYRDDWLPKIASHNSETTTTDSQELQIVILYGFHVVALHNACCTNIQ